MAKKSAFLRILSLLGLMGLAACGQAGAPSGPTAIPVPPGWKLAWHDEFDGPAGTKPDPANWNYDLGAGGWGNNELEYYTDRAENASLDGKGSLAITAIEYIDPSTSGLNCTYCMYSSARLLTRDRYTFQYGRVEARLRLPVGQGVWPAFWMLGEDLPQVGWPRCGEIDIMENKGSEPSVVHGTLHGPDYSAGKSIGKAFTLDAARFTDDYHVFAIEWEASEIRWYVDGQQYNAVTPDQVSGPWVFDHPFFIILNLAIGGGYVGMPDYTTTFPQTMLVDYVRVFQRN